MSVPPWLSLSHPLGQVDWLTGYAGGLELKRALLTLEARAMGTSGA